MHQFLESLIWLRRECLKTPMTTLDLPMTANTAAIHTDRIMQCNHMHICVVIRSYVATLCITMCYVCIYKDLSTSLASYLSPTIPTQ